MIENDCIVTRVGVYNEISPEPSGNPSGSALGISLGLRRYFIVYPSSRHNTVTFRAHLHVFTQVLLDRGLDEQHRDNAGWGPLHYAAFEGHSAIVKLLGSAG